MPQSAVHEEAVESFNRQGFAVLSRHVPEADIATIEAQLQRYIDQVLPTLPAKAAFYEDKDNPATLFRLDALHEHDPFFGRLIEEERFLSLAASLLGDEAVPQGVAMFGKAPRVGNETPVHQDSFYFMIEPDEALTLWLPLDRTDEANGCISYVPGSQRRGLQPHGRSEVFGFSLGLLTYTDDDRAAEVAVHVRPGDLIAHHGLTYHRADPNRSDRRRWAVGLVYFAARAKVDEARRAAHHQATIQQWSESGKT